MSIITESDAENTIREFISLWDERKYRFLGVFLKDCNIFVAQIYLGKLDDHLPEFGIGYFADVDQEGKWYVTEAVSTLIKVLFEKVGTHRIRIECDDSNSRSIAVAERCGFVREGHFRKNKLNPDGSYTGTLFFGLLKDEYSEKRKNLIGSELL